MVWLSLEESDSQPASYWTYLREFEHITLARALRAQHRAQPSEAALDAAARLLERLLQAAEAGEPTGSVIELLVLRALTDHARGDVPGALATLERALTLAEPEGTSACSPARDHRSRRCREGSRSSGRGGTTSAGSGAPAAMPNPPGSAWSSP